MNGKSARARVWLLGRLSNGTDFAFEGNQVRSGAAIPGGWVRRKWTISPL
jgi:hypothetical protein